MGTNPALDPIPPELIDRAVTLEVQRPRGAARVVAVSASTLYVQTAGHLDTETARQICAATLRAAATAQVFSLVDWSAMHSYDAGARQAITQMVLSNHRQFAGVLVLTNSTIVSVGVSTAGLAAALVGVTVNATTERDVFFAALRLRSA